MAKFQSPLLGYNNNVRHKNRVFHLQTEDSGVNHPHIITHLFMDGGRILKSVKKSYAEHVGVEGMSEIVRGLMKEQHKAMFIALRDGQFDHLVNYGSSPGVPAPAAPAAARAPAAPAKLPVARADSGELAAPTIPDPSARTIDESRRSQPRQESAPAPVSAIAVAARVAMPESEPVPTTTRQPPREPDPGAPALTLDFEALEHAEDGSSSLFRTNDLPPPPKNLFAKEVGTGKYRAVESEAHKQATAARASRPPPPSARTPAAPARPTNKPPSSEGRYAPARPAAIFGSGTLRPQSSVFSDELLGDKSLDEVILSYLAEDLEPPRRK